MKGETFIRSITFLKLSCFGPEIVMLCASFFLASTLVYIDGQTVRERERESQRYRKTERTEIQKKCFFKRRTNKERKLTDEE